MFPFGNSSNGNPTLHCSVPPSSFHSSNSSIFGLNGNQVLLHQHDLDHHLPYLGPNGHLIDNNSPVMFATNNVIINSNKSNKNKKAVKKDRHSKILTSQGHRDRRVRLSIGVAHKFFDLQDMLGFDKPSKTLDWLFSKSKLAIEELSDAKKSATPSSVNNSECDEDIVVVPAAPADELTKRAKQERESRDKARARARERTMKKIWTQIEAKSLLVKEQTKMEQIMNLSGPNREAATSRYNNCTRNWDHDNDNPTIMSSMAAATICCTPSSQVQKAWDTYHGSQL